MFPSCALHCGFRASVAEERAEDVNAAPTCTLIAQPQLDLRARQVTMSRKSGHIGTTTATTPSSGPCTLTRCFLLLAHSKKFLLSFGPVLAEIQRGEKFACFYPSAISFAGSTKHQCESSAAFGLASSTMRPKSPTMRQHQSLCASGPVCLRYATASFGLTLTSLTGTIPKSPLLSDFLDLEKSVGLSQEWENETENPHRPKRPIQAFGKWAPRGLRHDVYFPLLDCRGTTKRLSPSIPSVEVTSHHSYQVGKTQADLPCVLLQEGKRRRRLLDIGCTYN